MSCKGKNKIKNNYFNRKLLLGKESIILEIINYDKIHYIEQLNIMGGVDIFDLKGNKIILDIETNVK